jgi:hypothetical protein
MKIDIDELDVLIEKLKMLQKDMNYVHITDITDSLPPRVSLSIYEVLSVFAVLNERIKILKSKNNE